ncbi:MAG: ATP-dependent DNA helicase [Gammaproteobacteria bacterium]|nr:ATP-dependent DNA helicase [Gammaproteobacteria bacterium]
MLDSPAAMSDAAVDSTPAPAVDSATVPAPVDASLAALAAAPTAAEALAHGGVFHRAMPHFTPRAAQQEMAAAVEETLAAGGPESGQEGGVLVVESGTGTGKTFAYLAPALLSGRRAIISTATRHLQDQIFQRDLPQVARALGVALGAVLLKGRANYLCRHRLKLEQRQRELPEGPKAPERPADAGTDAETAAETETETAAAAESFTVIEQWAAATKSGDIAEVAALGEESPLWKRVTSTADNCLGGACPEFKNCFVVKARHRALQADIVVVNHHLFFSDLTLKAEGFGELLPQHDAVIFDEAHHIAETASRFFGFSVSGGRVAELARDAAAAERDEKSGVDLTPAVAATERALQRMRAATQTHAGQSVDFDALQSAAFDSACAALTEALAAFEAALEAAAPAGEGLRRCHERCREIQAHLDAWLHAHDSAQVRWAEIAERGFRLHSTPLNIGAGFAAMRAAHPAAWIFTSGTLAVGDDFSAFCERLGLHDAHTRRWESPYNFRANALLYLPPDMPDPRADEFAEALTSVIAQVAAAGRGRAFCLFTSYEMMRRAHRRLAARDDCDWPLLLQGDAPKTELLARFRRSGRALLFGAASFWEGVDVVGEELSCVVIDKLPFASPADPVLKSRIQACAEAGGNPFVDIQIPQAVLALKQGAGRLIRAESDRGVLVLCDPRIVSQRYGRWFRDNLPDMPVTRSIGDVAGFFGGDGGAGGGDRAGDGDGAGEGSDGERN